MKKQTLVRDATVMLLALFAAYAMVMLTQAVMGRIEGVAMLIFMLAVFVTSMYTEGYAWGVAASLIPVRVAALRRMGVEQDALRRETFLKKRSLPRAFRRGAHPSFSKGFPHRANASADISFFSGKRYRRNQ